MKYVDPDGNFVNLAAAGIGALIGAGTSAIIAACSGASGREIAAAAVGGAVTGGLAGFTCGASLGVQIAGAALAGTAGYCAENLVAGNEGSVEGMAAAAMSSAGGSMLGTLLGTALSTYSSRISQINYIRQKSVHNPEAPKIMLGKYDGGGPSSYINRAGTEYEYFSLGNEWDAIKSEFGYTDKDMFKKFNIPFLDKGIKGNKIFQFSHNPVGDTGALGQEYNYLMKNGYKWDPDTLTAMPK